MLGRPESLQTLMEDMRHAASKPSTFASSFIPVFALPVDDFLQLESPEEAAALALQDEIIADAAKQQPTSTAQKKARKKKKKKPRKPAKRAPQTVQCPIRQQIQSCSAALQGAEPVPESVPEEGTRSGAVSDAGQAEVNEPADEWTLVGSSECSSG